MEAEFRMTSSWSYANAIPGLPADRPITPGVLPKLTPRQRDEIRQRFAKEREANPELKPWAFARQVCLEYGVSTAVINSLVN